MELLDSVIDGDTLRLKDGRKVRVMAIDTPELVGENGHPQAWAKEARDAAVEFFQHSSKVGLKSGLDKHDRYGRLLAHVL